MIIEPITQFNNEYATPYYFKRLRQIAKENNIPFIINETATGFGSSGKLWAHEYWFLNDAPDIVTFGGKAGISGFYSTTDFKLSDLDIIFE